MNVAPNQEQIKSIVRWVITAFGAGLAGWLAHSGFVTKQQVMDILNSPAFFSLAVSAVGLVWGLLTHTKSNAVTVANSLPEVSGVVLTNTGDGRALASAVGAAGVAVAGSVTASKIAAPAP